MIRYKIGDVVRLRTDEPERLPLIVRAIETQSHENVTLCVSECGKRISWADPNALVLINRPDPQADLKQAIREVLLSDEFMAKFAAAWMKTPNPVAIPPTKRDQELIDSLKDYPFGEPAEVRAIPGAPVGWKLVGFKQIQDDVKVFDEDGDYWTFGGTNDAGDLTGALMPIFEKIEATNEPT